MKIPLGGFGNVVAQPEQQVRVPQSDGIGRAIAGAGDTLFGASMELRRAEEQKRNADAAVVLATTTNDMHSLHDDMALQLQDGRLSSDRALPEFAEKRQALVAERTKGLTSEQRQVIEAQLVRSYGALERSLNGQAIRRSQQDTGASLVTMSEQLQRAAMRDLPAAIGQWDTVADMVGPAAGWDPTRIAEAKQKFKEGATFNFANATLEGAAQTGDIELVRAARKRIEGDEGEAIDPARRTALITKAYAFENGILASNAREAEKANREQEAREKAGRTAYEGARDLMLNGRYLSTEYLSGLADITAGTSAAPAVQELVKSQAEVAGFASMPLSKQQAVIEQMRRPGSTPGTGTSPDQEKLIEYMQRIHDGGDKAYKENPWQAAQERAVIEAAPVINLGSVQDAQKIIAQRMKQIDQVEVAADRKISPLQPQEAETIGRMIKALPPDQQSTALAGIGDLVKDADRIADLAHQFDSKDKVLGTAMMFANSKTTIGRHTSELVLRGERAIRDKAIAIDSRQETGWRAQIAQEIGDAFLNQEVRARMIDAAYYIQAGFSAEGGGEDIARAVRMAAGRIIEQPNGKKLPLPPGMEERTFEKRIESIQPADLASQASNGMVYVGQTQVPLDEFVKSLPEASLVHAGPGRYNVSAGSGLVLNQQGKRITIEVR